VPSQFGSTVQSVLGLNNAPMDLFIKHARKARSPRLRTDGAPPCQLVENGICVLNSYTAAGFNMAYNTAGVSTAKGTSVAVFTEGNVAQVPKDLRAYEAYNKLPQVPFSVRQVSIPSSDVAGLDEWDLDTQSSSAIAGYMKHLYLYNTSGLDDLSLTLDYNRFVHEQLAQIANASFGGCEIFNVEDGSLFIDDSIFLQAAIQGQTVFASAGDNGSGCPVAASTGAPSGLPFMSYPASSPYVMGVGGTTMLTNASDGSYNAEITWIGTGGGLSAIENSPFWQTPLFTKGGTRAVPDIAMDADPNTGADIIVNGAHLGVGGTSLSSPLSVGTYARLQTINRNRLGNAGPTLYYAYYAAGGQNPPTPGPGQTTQLIGGFHDILLGADGYYSALPGFDLTTGMGTFDVGLTAKLVK
jgi:subtilase family serine protease